MNGNAILFTFTFKSYVLFVIRQILVFDIICFLVREIYFGISMKATVLLFIIHWESLRILQIWFWKKHDLLVFSLFNLRRSLIKFYQIFTAVKLTVMSLFLIFTILYFVWLCQFIYVFPSDGFSELALFDEWVLKTQNYCIWWVYLQIAEDYSHSEFLIRLPGYCPSTLVPAVSRLLYVFHCLFISFSTFLIP